VAALTVVAMLAFAANSLLCRVALGRELIDAATFATVRIIAGAVTLGLIALPRWRNRGRSAPDWWAAAMLFVYVAGFSFAYVTLGAGTGALILFSAVQLTMFVVALRGGEHFPLPSWLGLAIAVAGLVYLVSPGLSAPDPLGAVLMALAGIAWGVYSLRGRGAADPLSSTASNFICVVPMVILLILFFRRGHSRVATRPGPCRNFGRRHFGSGLRRLVCGASWSVGHAGSDGTAVGAGDRRDRRSPASRRTDHVAAARRIRGDAGWCVDRPDSAHPRGVAGLSLDCGSAREPESARAAAMANSHNARRPYSAPIDRVVAS
jgi:hypothetical protein